MNKPFLVADLFCGAGGSSTGAEKAVKSLGATMLLTCVNHWPLAIETHRRNHPTARHYIEDISVAKPVNLVPEGRLDLLMASPECTHFSRARGGKPMNDQSRMNPWAVIRWLTDLDVRCLLVENVGEFTQWGPLTDANRPHEKRRGRYFEAWIRTLWELGYQTEWKMLNAADYGDATTRTRFFLIARKDGVPIQWPEPTHAPDGAGEMFPRLPRWRAAREIIDWQNPGRSLLDDPKYRKRPLSVNTLRRIARGLERYGGPFADLYIQLLGMESDCAGDSATPEPFIIPQRNHATPKRMDQPIPTITASNGGGTIAMVNPRVEPFVLGQQSCAVARNVGQPIPTVSTAGAISLVEPQLVEYYGNGGTCPVDVPLPTVTTKPRFGLVEPQLVVCKGLSSTSTIDKPVPAVTTRQYIAVMEPTAEPGDTTNIDPRRLVSIDGQTFKLDIRFRMLDNRELARATGFDDHETEYEFVGNATEVTRQIGNAVPVNMAAALVTSILGAELPASAPELEAVA